MKKVLWSLSISLATSLAASGQSPSVQPAASLGAPRASLGLPQPSRPTIAPILPANAEEILPPIIPAQDFNPPSPYRFIDAPKPMPKDASKDPNVVVPSKPATTTPALTSSALTEEPLFQLAPEAPPFINRDRLKFSAEYLAWWTNSYPTPALVTAGPASSDGALGQAGVTTLFGNQSETIPNFRSGVRFGYEYWCGKCRNWGFDGHLFFLSQSGSDNRFNSGTNTLLARPFDSLNTGGPSSEIVGFPGLFAGGIAVGNSSKIWGTDINLRRKFWQGERSYIDGLVGFRYLSLQESLRIEEQSTRLAPDANPVVGDPSQFIVSGHAFDQFSTSNQFYGGQIGAAFGCARGRWVLDLRTMLAIGSTTSIVQISGGQSNIMADGSNVVSQGGLLALNSNIGRHYREQFTIVPELTLNLGYNISDHCRVFVGYNILYWSNVLRPGDQIDTSLDVNRIPNFRPSPNIVPNARPAFLGRDRDFIAQGINLGLMLKW
ncbi:MAG: BBP7 family outer membrane beta-barrel protein [Planctomycetes bacterium]|nr:BBP7 family outer membrane beta-barrel protein [Planctomycetota bacterium]